MNGITKHAYRLELGENALAPLLYSSPHSGTIYPQHMRDALRVPLVDLQRTEDAYIDELFSAVPHNGASLLTARYARSYVDLNRNPCELDAAMFEGGLPRTAIHGSSRVEAGLGCLPKIGASGELIYSRKLNLEDGKHRLTQVHDTYHRALKTELLRLRAKWGQAFLIDCHSMPSRQPGRRDMPDIILGDRFGASCVSYFVQAVENAFKRRGYSVGRNAPYAGGYTTSHYGHPRSHIHALQIEINRRLYLNETLVEKNDNFSQIQTDMANISAEITTFVRNRTAPLLAAE